MALTMMDAAKATVGGHDSCRCSAGSNLELCIKVEAHRGRHPCRRDVEEGDGYQGDSHSLVSIQCYFFVEATRDSCSVR